VTGPFKINGVPLKRVNQAYVLPTTTKVNEIDEESFANIDDAYFARIKIPKEKKTEAGFFATKKEV